MIITQKLILKTSKAYSIMILMCLNLECMLHAVLITNRTLEGSKEFEEEFVDFMKTEGKSLTWPSKKTSAGYQLSM